MKILIREVGLTILSYSVTNDGNWSDILVLWGVFRSTRLVSWMSGFVGVNNYLAKPFTMFTDTG